MMDIFTLRLEVDQAKINEAYSTFLTKINFTLENDSSLTNQEIFSTLKTFSYFYEKKPEYREEIDFYFKKVLFGYQDQFSAEQKFSVLSLCDNEKILEQYIQTNYEVLLNYFKSHVFVDRSIVDDLTDLFEFQIDLDLAYPNEHYQACWWYADLPIYLLYRYFSKEIKLLEDNKIKHTTFKTMSNLSVEQLLDLLATTDFFKEDVKLILKIIFSRPLDKKVDQFLIEKWFSAFQTIGVDNSLTIIGESFDEFLFSLTSDFNYTSFFRELVLSEEPCEVKTLFSVRFFQALNRLNCLERRSLTKDTLYLKTFRVFFTEFVCHYRDPITIDNLSLIEVLFKRAIHGKDIFLMLKINNEKSLIHYYKTDEFVSSFSCSKKELDNYKAKQYFVLRNIFVSKKTEKQSCHGKLSDEEVSLLIQGLNLLGFELCKKICLSSKCTLKEVVEYLIKKDQTYIEKVKKLLGEFVTSSSEHELSLSLFFTAFDTFYTQGIDKITFPRLEKAIYSSKFLLLPHNYFLFPYLEKLNLVAKGDPFREKLAGINLYEEYRHRLTSTIPDMKGKYQGCDYEMVDLHSPEILSNGIGCYLFPNGEKASSCLTPNGKAASCLRHGALNPNGRFFKVMHQDKLIAYSWVWRSGEVVCFDNIEITEEVLKVKSSEELIYKIYQLAGETIREITKQEEQGGVKLVVVGRNPKDISNCYIDFLPQVNDYTDTLYKPDGCTDELYLKDSAEKQVILVGKYSPELNTRNSEAIYLYRRLPVYSFSSLSVSELNKKINAIYYEYCLERGQKYIPLSSNYKRGYFNEDWFVGYLPDGKQDFYYVQNDDRLFEESKPYLEQEILIVPTIIPVISPINEQEKRILDIHNFSFDSDKIHQYLQEVSNQKELGLEEGYSHTTNSLKTLNTIFHQKAITASLYGNHEGGNGCNGGYYISVAKIGSDAYKEYATTGTMILEENLFVHKNQLHPNNPNIGFAFSNSSYPYRLTNFDGEYHVFRSIPIEKVKALLAKATDIEKIIQLFYLEDLYEMDIPLICMNNYQEIDKQYIKKYSKLR